jgi:hypothetical protein
MKLKDTTAETRGTKLIAELMKRNVVSHLFAICSVSLAEASEGF